MPKFFVSNKTKLHCKMCVVMLFFKLISSSALDKLLGQLGIYATWLSSVAYLQKQLRISYIFYATFLAVITYIFLMNEAIANVPTYLLSSPVFPSVKLADFYCT